MKSLGYWIGFGASFGLVSLAGWWIAGLNARASLEFSPPYLDVTSDEILVGDTKEFFVRLVNRGTKTIVLDAIDSSSRSAVGRIGGGLSASLSPSESLPVGLEVTADSQRVGVLELEFTARGRSLSHAVAPTLRLAVKVVDYANADPVVVSFGTVSRRGEPLRRSVALWTPYASLAPDVTEVSANEPCLAVNVTKAPKMRDNGRHYNFADIKIELDPRKSPRVLREDLIVRTTANQLRIPVLAVVDLEVADR